MHYRVVGVNSTRGHAVVFGLDDDGNTKRLKHTLDRLGNLLTQSNRFLACCADRMVALFLCIGRLSSCRCCIIASVEERLVFLCHGFGRLPLRFGLLLTRQA